MKTRFIALVILGLFLSALISRNGNILVLALPFLTYLGIGILHSPPAMELRAHRFVNKKSPAAFEPTQMQVVIENRGAALVNLLLDDDHFQTLDVIEGNISRRVAISASDKVKVNYTFQAGRGVYSWKTIHAVASDPFGLYELEHDVPASTEIQIFPNSMRLRQLPLRPRFTTHTAGSIPARLAGSGINFWGLREYVPGDSLRRLNWRMTARHPGELFTKEFELEEIADIGLILDARTIADFHIGGESLFEYSVQATASLAEAFLRDGNRVGLLIFGKTVSSLFPGYGKHQLDQIRRNLARAKADANLSLIYLQHISARLFPRRSLLILISPVASHDLATYASLRTSGYQTILISPDPVDFALRTLPVDQTNAIAGRTARLERFLLLKQLLRAGVQVINWPLDRPLNETIHTALIRARNEIRPGK